MASIHLLSIDCTPVLECASSHTNALVAHTITVVNIQPQHNLIINYELNIYYDMLNKINNLVQTVSRFLVCRERSAPDWENVPSHISPSTLCTDRVKTEYRLPDLSLFVSLYLSGFCIIFYIYINCIELPGFEIMRAYLYM